MKLIAFRPQDEADIKDLLAAHRGQSTYDYCTPQNLRPVADESDPRWGKLDACSMSNRTIAQSSCPPIRQNKAVCQYEHSQTLSSTNNPQADTIKRTMSEPKRNCEGTPRRDLLKLGVGSFLGLGFVDLLRQQARASGHPRRRKVQPRQGQLHPHLAGRRPQPLRNLRPQARRPHRNPRRVQAHPHHRPRRLLSPKSCPSSPAIADKFTVIRSICHKDPNHGGGNHYMMTGAPTPVPVGCGAFVTFHPSYGSVVSWKRGIRERPARLHLDARDVPLRRPQFPRRPARPVRHQGRPQQHRLPGPRCRPARRKSPQAAISPASSSASSLDRMQRIADAAAEDPAVAFDSYYQQGLDLVTAAKAQAAFDISKEPDNVRDQYGRNDFGQRLLLCRRLVEVGVSFVTCYTGGWDHHTKHLQEPIKGTKVRQLDQGLSALITDLDSAACSTPRWSSASANSAARPRVNKDAGRDHWPHAMSILAAGAGIPRGQVIGATDRQRLLRLRQRPLAPKTSPPRLYTKMGIDPTEHLHTNTGRPVQLVNGGKPIKELFA